jgi:hypothetical protein
MSVRIALSKTQEVPPRLPFVAGRVLWEIGCGEGEAGEEIYINNEVWILAGSLLHIMLRDNVRAYVLLTVVI